MEFPNQSVEKPGIFKRQKQPVESPEVADELRNVNMRVKIIEERYTNIRRTIQVNEQNMISSHKSANSEIKVINSEIIEIKREIELIKTKITNVITHLGSFARKEDVNVLEKYINLLDPTRYITAQEAENIIKRTLEENKG